MCVLVSAALGQQGARGSVVQATVSAGSVIRSLSQVKEQSVPCVYLAPLGLQ